MSIESANDAVPFADENGIAVKHVHATPQAVYMEVQPSATLADFYTWAEITPGQQPMQECWRPFLWSSPNIGSNDGLKEIELGPGSVFSILEGYFGLRVDGV